MYFLKTRIFDGGDKVLTRDSYVSVEDSITHQSSKYKFFTDKKIKRKTKCRHFVTLVYIKRFIK